MPLVLKQNLYILSTLDCNQYTKVHLPLVVYLQGTLNDVGYGFNGQTIG